MKKNYGVFGGDFFSILGRFVLKECKSIIEKTVARRKFYGHCSKEVLQKLCGFASENN